MQKVIVNGKFFSAEMTGVHRVAIELLKSCFEILAERPELRKQIEFEIWVPHDGVAGAIAHQFPYKVIGPLRGIGWEQITLPIRARGQLVLSLCNVGPMALHNAVTMYHDAQVSITPDSYSFAFRAWYWLHQSVAGRRHRRILTVSEFSREQLDHFRIVPEARTAVIHNGVDHVQHTEPDPDIIRRLGLRPRGYAVGLANLQAHKNIAMLISAFADPLLADIDLVLFGSATRADFEQQGLTIPRRVIFAGRVSDGELRALYADAACIAFPSTTEGFGLPPLEAMQMGCPAIVAPQGALPEVCGDAAIYVDAHSPQDWARAICDIANDPVHFAELSQAGRIRAQKFTWRSAASRLIDELLALPE
jgi:glycosyltransferase involved in cell wall biosynthesis